MAEFTKVTKTDDIEPGKVKVYEVASKKIAICNVDGTFYAIDDICTHDGGPLDQGELLDGQIECPRHGALFDVKTGRALTLPAVAPVKSYAVQVDGGDIKVEVDG